ncbi:glycerate kinase [Persicitalea jodogahamensis]|uniref:Glycerate kinase n=1 Tax=Persicitalea jodogahamensis TaxID=402147 RepID=A0A8J3D2H7_9BACT|nr:glycerate kinase [Persicitalea jodogahamensis]GHB58934.1 glycerate kinase [Persicitalea jodogahamensis]
MKILLAPDKFRGSLETDEVCTAMASGVRLAFPEAEVVSVPLADGGEGFAKALTLNSGGEYISLVAQDPLRRPIEAAYGLSADKRTAFIEMAAASGLGLLNETERDPMVATSYGTGQLIADALEHGVESIILGIGGSATNDAGTGMAAALGFRFFDKNKKEIFPQGGSLAEIQSIDSSGIHPKLPDTRITVACDVTNPLYGANGAAYIYGPQKGASPQQVEKLDNGLCHLSEIATRTFGRDTSQMPGAGAAGGVGAGVLWFLNAVLRSGAAIVFEQTQLESQIRDADLVITGEGKMDRQTLSGKLVLGVADMCARYNVPVAAVCGTLALSPEEIKETGITYAVSVIDRPLSLEDAQRNAFALVEQATFHLVRLFFYGK